MVCLIYTPSALRLAALWLWVYNYIRQTTRAHGITIKYLPKVGIKLLLIISLVFTRVKNLIPCFLAFWSTSGRFNPYLPLKFLIFIILVMLTTCAVF